MERKLHFAARITLASALLGGIACGTPNIRMSDESIKNYCGQTSAFKPTLSATLIDVRNYQPDNPQDLVNTNIALMDGNQNITRITFDPDSDDGDPALSPDQSKVAFTRRGPIKSLPNDRFTNDFSGKEGVYTVGIDGTDLQRLTTLPDNHVIDGQPSWSPDGAKLVFVRNSPTSEFRQYELFAISSDGSNLQKLPLDKDPKEPIHAPRYSPDGKHLAFQGSNSLLVASLDGKEIDNLSDGKEENIDGKVYSFEWLPDSRELLVRRFFQIDDIEPAHQTRLVTIDGTVNKDVSPYCPRITYDD